MRYVLAFLVVGQLAFADIVGQKASYELDKDPARTSKMIKSGNLTATITKPMLDAATPAYEVTVQYKAKVALMGDQEGEEVRPVDAGFFSPEFLEKLRKEGSYEGPNFKATHLGYADATTLEGKTYPHCDKVRIYDLKDSSQWEELARVFFGAHRADMEDLEILALIYPGVPVLGAVKLDASGKYEGLPVKAGGDYRSQR